MGSFFFILYMLFWNEGINFWNRGFWCCFLDMVFSESFFFYYILFWICRECVFFFILICFYIVVWVIWWGDICLKVVVFWKYCLWFLFCNEVSNDLVLKVWIWDRGYWIFYRVYFKIFVWRKFWWFIKIVCCLILVVNDGFWGCYV